MGLLEDLMRVKRELDATAPPPMYAVKCHPMHGYLLSQTLAALVPDTLRGLWTLPPIYHDATMPLGQVLVAQTRQMADFWRTEAQMAYWEQRREQVGRLVTVLRRVLDQR